MEIVEIWEDGKVERIVCCVEGEREGGETGVGRMDDLTEQRVLESGADREMLEMTGRYERLVVVAWDRNEAADESFEIQQFGENCGESSVCEMTLGR